MKHCFRFLSMLAVMLMTGVSAWAADWTVNLPSPVAINSGDTIYMRNVGTGLYLGAGEAWGTQAVGVPLANAAKVILVQLSDGTYEVKNNAPGDWVKNNNANMLYRQPVDGNLGSGNKGVFTDYSGSWNLKSSKWTVADVGGNRYTFQVPNTDSYSLDSATITGVTRDSLSIYVAGEYLGLNRAHASNWAADTSHHVNGVTNGLYYDVVYADSAANCQWELLPAAVTEAKILLEKQVASASELGIDISKYAAILENANATAEEVRAASSELADLIETNANPSHPQDLTSKYIPNPTPISAATQTGWTVTMKDGSAGNTGDSSDNVGEIWNNAGVKLSYTIKDLPAGVYRFTLVALTRTGMESKFFAGKDTVNIITVPASTVNNRGAANTWFGQDADGDGVLNGTNVINLMLPEAGDVNIGLISDTLTGDHWTVWKSFKMESLGQGLESFQYVNQDLLNQIQELTSQEGAIYAQSVADAATATATTGANATDKETASQAYLTAYEQVADLRANIAAYATLDKNTTAADEEHWARLSDQDELGDAVDESRAMVDEHTASTAEVNAQIAKLAAALDLARKNSYQPGDDVTYLITNPTFNDESVTPSATQPQSHEGWTEEGASFGTGGTVDMRLCEVWQANFNIYQDIKNMKPGAYQLNIQAFLRTANNDVAWPRYQAGTETVPAWIYMGSTEQRWKSFYSVMFDQQPTETASYETVADADGTVHYVVNTMATAYEAMAADPNAFLNSVVGVVTEQGGTMRIGIRSNDPDGNGGRWAIFHDFTMTYLGPDAQYVKPVLDQKIAEAQAITNPMASTERAILDNAISSANTASAGTDGQAMLDAYKALASAIDTANVSIDAYKSLQATLDSLQDERDGATQAAEEAKATADKLITEVTNTIADGSISIKDIPAKQAEMRDAYHALMLQPGSDDNPSDYTAWIQHPTFDAGLNGWTLKKTSGAGNPTADNNVAEIWNATADIYQDITGLPEGTYQVKLKGFFRPVSVKQAWEEFLGDSIEDISRAKIYANKDSIEPNFWAGRFEGYSATGNGWTEAIDSTTEDSVKYFLPNQRANARVVFDAEKYLLDFYTYVDASGTLRLGFINKEVKPQDWLVVSDWELYYLGTESAHETTTGITDINNKAKVTVDEIYTVDGQRIGKLQRGINIVRGKTADGKVITRKVMVK